MKSYVYHVSGLSFNPDLAWEEITARLTRIHYA